MSERTRVYRRTAATPPCFDFTTPITEHDIAAIKALAKGEATPHQQTLALACIVKSISGAWDQDFVPGHTDQSNFRSGRGFVGKTIERFVKTDLNKLVGAPDEK